MRKIFYIIIAFIFTKGLDRGEFGAVSYKCRLVLFGDDSVKVLVTSEKTENRVAVTPDIAKKFVDLGHKLVIEAGAGVKAGFADVEYEKAGATTSNDGSDLQSSDVILSVNFPQLRSMLAKPKPGAIVIATNADLEACEEYKLTAFALEKIPRTTRAQYMDVLSSQASLAGYKAVIEAAHALNRAIPLMMTTAGTVPAARVLVIGAGVAGLQAIATAKRLGAIVSAFDVRAAAKEQVESLGAKFVEVAAPDALSERTEGVYAKEMSDEYRKAQEQKLREVLPVQDIVITTAQIPGKRAPVILKSDMVDAMKNGAVIVDLAARTGGNCEITEAGKTVERGGVKVLGFNNILDLIAHDASRLYAKNVFAFFELLMTQMKDQPDVSKMNDDIIKATVVVREEGKGGLGAGVKVVGSRSKVCDERNTSELLDFQEKIFN